MIVEDADGISVIDDDLLAADVERLFISMASPAVFSVTELRAFAASVTSLPYLDLTLLGVTNRWAQWFAFECPTDQLAHQAQRLQAFAMTCRLIRMELNIQPDPEGDAT